MHITAPPKFEKEKNIFAVMCMYIPYIKRPQLESTSAKSWRAPLFDWFFGEKYMGREGEWGGNKIQVFELQQGIDD